MPALEKQDMYVQLEELAQSLVNSGLLRIDAEPKRNFARFSLPTRNIHIVFSNRELFEEHLSKRTRKQIKAALVSAGENKDLDNKINLEIAKLKLQLKKFVEVEPDLEMQLARILVQSAHPVVFSMIILNEVQVFVSYGHNIGEVMDVVSWQQAGSNSGMQSTDGKNVAIFVSCGGDPLRLEEPQEEEGAKDQNKYIEEPTYGDGIPALARMMGIAGQETGHYSDIKHNLHGQQYSRYSANFSGTRADPQVNLARTTDMKNIDNYWIILQKLGIERLLEIEQRLQFFDRQSHKDTSYHLKYFWMKLVRMIFSWRAARLKIIPVKELKTKKYLGIELKALFSDMAFNLAPEADVYSSPDKNVETAIACIEALARVPQQVNKWGHLNTIFFWRNLYKFYYHKLIPSDIADFERMSGTKFNKYPHKFRRYSMLEKLNFKLDSFKDRIRKKFR